MMMMELLRRRAAQDGQSWPGLIARGNLLRCGSMNHKSCSRACRMTFPRRWGPCSCTCPCLCYCRTCRCPCPCLCHPCRTVTRPRGRPCPCPCGRGDGTCPCPCLSGRADGTFPCPCQSNSRRRANTGLRSNSRPRNSSRRRRVTLALDGHDARGRRCHSTDLRNRIRHVPINRDGRGHCRRKCRRSRVLSSWV